MAKKLYAVHQNQVTLDHLVLHQFEIESKEIETNQYQNLLEM